MRVIYARQPLPASFTKSLFLAGPTPRSPEVTSWRPEALDMLRELGYDGVVFVPEDETWTTFDDERYLEQVSWEQDAMHRSDAIAFWIPRDLTVLHDVPAGASADRALRMPAFTTNVEFGLQLHFGRSVLGTPGDAPKLRYLRKLAERHRVPMTAGLRQTLALAVERIGEGALRTGGECGVPIAIWNSPAFRHWHAAQRRAGNAIVDTRVEWAHRSRHHQDATTLWAVHVTLHVAREDREKSEVVHGRPPTVFAVLYGRANTLEDMPIVLVREARPAAATRDGYAWELPGGTIDSGEFEGMSVEASREVQEETGLRIEPARLRYAGVRQPIATLSAHRSGAVVAELTRDELAWLRTQVGTPRGLAEETERTYPEIRTLGEIMREELVDWATLGMILSALRITGAITV